jgi:chondroitin 4-sulfotransferase 11
MSKITQIRRRALRYRDSIRVKYFLDYVFIHINKTGGSSVEKALGFPFQHKTALTLRSEIGVRRWAERFSFSVVRNPWDKVASHYHHRVRTNQSGLRDSPIDFNEWVKRAYGERDPRYYDREDMFMPQTDWLCDDTGAIIVDFVAKFENLEEDFRTICDVLGRTATLSHLKRSANRDYRNVYDDAAIHIVRGHFADDIANFGYEFGESHAT